MELFHYPNSPFAMKVLITLYEKGLPFEERVLQSPEDFAELRRMNPRGEVPAFRDGDEVICDSRVICEYLDEAHPEPPLLPTDPALRARCRAIELLVDGRLEANVVVLGRLWRGQDDLASRYPGASTHLEDALGRLFARLEQELGDREYLAGDFSRADVAAIPHVGIAAFHGYRLPDSLPRLLDWVRRMNARPSVQRVYAQAVAHVTRSREGEAPDPREGTIYWRNDRLEAAVRAGLGPFVLEELAAGRARFSPVP